MSDREARPLDLGAAALPTYRVIRSARRRRTIEIAIDRGEVIVRAPSRTSDREIADLVRSRADWIARQQAQASPPALVDGASIPILGVRYTLTIEDTPAPEARVERSLLDVRVMLPTTLDAAEREATARDTLSTWLRAHATEVIPSIVARRVADLGRAPRRVLVRDQRKRWGSCAPDGTLRFNWRLVMLDPALIDYVAVHELAHLHQANHGPGFWRIVEEVLPDHRALRRQLREAGRLLPL